MNSMRVLFVDAPPELLEERRRLGLDHRDELWEGVVHVVPQPESGHQVTTFRFGAAVLPLADERGLLLAHEVAVYQPGLEEEDYRVPDLVVARREYVRRRGVAGPPELVVETLSPQDESRDKFPFYATLGCREVLLIDRAHRSFELSRLLDGELVRVAGDSAGSVHIEALGVGLTVVGDALLVHWDGGQAEVPFGD